MQCSRVITAAVSQIGLATIAFSIWVSSKNLRDGMREFGSSEMSGAAHLEHELGELSKSISKKPLFSYFSGESATCLDYMAT
jgi:hypothetical protein